MSWTNRCGGLVSAILKPYVGPNAGVEHTPMPLTGIASCLEPGQHHQKPACGKTPQSHSITDAVLHVPVDPCPKALHGACSISTFLIG